ncbi:MAG: acyl-CoA dehydrogenase family protein [Pseudomonadota bacterium]
MSYLDISMELTDEHLALRDNVRKFALDVLRPASLVLDKHPPEKVIEQGSLYWDCMKKMYELQYHTVLTPDEYGGLGLDPLGVHIVFENLAYGSVGFTVSLGCALFSPFLASMVPDDNLIEKVIMPFVECRDASVMSCWGITEPNHGSDNLMPGTEFFHQPEITHQVKASRKNGGYVLNGQKSAWVSNGPIATNSTLFVGLDPSLGMAGGGVAIVDLTQPGVSRGKPLDKLGQRELPQGEIFFEDAVVPGEFMIIDPESYEVMTEVVLATANASMGAFFTGVAQAAYDLALEYSGARVQGGKPIARHQAVQKKLFEMFTKVETARAFSRAAMIYNMNTTPPALQFSLASKVYCTKAAFDVASEAVQLFGGYGLSKEYPIEKIFRDARAGMIEDGSNDSLSVVGGAILTKEVLER